MACTIAALKEQPSLDDGSLCKLAHAEMLAQSLVRMKTDNGGNQSVSDVQESESGLAKKDSQQQSGKHEYKYFVTEVIQSLKSAIAATRVMKDGLRWKLAHAKTLAEASALMVETNAIESKDVEHMLSFAQTCYCDGDSSPMPEARTRADALEHSSCLQAVQR